MSKLDDIFIPVYAGSSDDDSVTKAKQQIKDLYIEVAYKLSIELKADIPYSKLVEEIEKL